MAKILITAFEPFGNHSHNPTMDLIRDPAVLNSSVSVATMILPVRYSDAYELLHKRVLEFQPSVVICLGLKADSDKITIETVARNHCGQTVDNEGQSHAGPIIANGPLELPSTLPVQAIYQCLTEKDIAVQFSDDAGGYLCNYLFFRLQYEYRHSSILSSGFIHVPRNPVFFLPHLLPVLDTHALAAP